MTMSYNEIHKMVNEPGFHQGPVTQFKMIFKYDKEKGWNQIENHLDLIQNPDHVRSICGDNPICWLDSVNYSVMHQTEATDFLYRFASWYPKETWARILENHPNLKEFVQEQTVNFISFLGGF